MIDHNEILKYRLADLGDQCKFCGKPLRTIKARFCVCGKEKE